MKRLQIICLLVLAINLPVLAQYRVAVIGSSTAGGTGAWPLDSSWVNRFNQYYKHKLQIVDSTYTLAVGGYPVYKGMPSSYVPPVNRDGPDHYKNVTMANKVLASLPIPGNAIVFVNYPSNKYEEYTIKEIMFCLQTIYDSVVKEGHRCFIITTQPRTGGVWDDPAMKRKLAVIKDLSSTGLARCTASIFMTGFTILQTAPSSPDSIPEMVSTTAMPDIASYSKE